MKWHKGRVSIRGFSWYLNFSIIFWERIATYRGHTSLKILNQMELWFCVYYVLNVGGYLYISPTGGIDKISSLSCQKVADSITSSKKGKNVAKQASVLLRNIPDYIRRYPSA